MKVKHVTIKRTEKFKYLGIGIQPNRHDKDVNRTRARKLELAYRLTQNRYKKRAISYNVKLRYHRTVINPKGLYVSECFTVKREAAELE